MWVLHTDSKRKTLTPGGGEPAAVEPTPSCENVLTELGAGLPLRNGGKVGASIMTGVKMEDDLPIAVYSTRKTNRPCITCNLVTKVREESNP